MDFEATVVGAGVVGLAVARELAVAGHEVLIVEAADAVGTQTSARNSEVIHAGIYYPSDSLKARMCVAGRRMLYEYCAQRGVPVRNLGKLIVATDTQQMTTLEMLWRQGEYNGVEDLALIDAAEARRLEPALCCTGALLSAASGIVDSHALMLALQGDAEAHGARCVLRTRIEAITCRQDEFDVAARTQGESEPATFRCRAIINCAGLGAQALAASIEGYPSKRIPPLFLAKGNYFSVSGPAPFSRLIYPVPVPGGAGIHVTLDLNGQMRLGPDLHWVEEIDYTPDDSVAEQFYSLVEAYWPEVRNRELNCIYSGIRPKIGGPGNADADFRVEGPEDHNIAGLVNFFGIELPGLTSALALAKHAMEKLGWR